MSGKAPKRKGGSGSGSGGGGGGGGRTLSRYAHREPQKEDDFGIIASMKRNRKIQDQAAYDQLSDSQRLAFDSIRAGNNTFVHGPAGTGKSHLIRFVCTELGGHGGMGTKSIAVTASTGRAAALIGGWTIHSWSGIWMGITKDTTLDMILARCCTGKFKRRWKYTDVLIIDEVSMLSNDILELLDAVGKHVRRKPHLPFGGLQVVGVGDFLQLPPVRTSRDPPHVGHYCFTSPVFDQLFPPDCGQRIEMTQNFRQAGDVAWQQALTNIRVGKITPKVVALLKSCVVPSTTASDMTPEEAATQTILYAKNDDVDWENRSKLEDLDGEMHKSKHEFKFVSWLKEEKRQKIAKQMLKNCNCDAIFRFKIGARVMHTVNNKTLNLCNGSLGIVAEISPRGNPVVDFECIDDPSQTVRVEVYKNTWESPKEHPDDERCIPDAVLIQYPLRLAFALTIHKTQGATLPGAVLAMGSIFEDNMFFVAASRVASSKKLKIMNFQPRVISTHRAALAIADSIAAKSAKAQAKQTGGAIANSAAAAVAAAQSGRLVSDD